MTTSENKAGFNLNKNVFRVSLLGAEGTGKSCFLAGLAFLGFDPLQASLKIYPHDSETAHYLNSLDRAFRNGLFPPPTNITSSLHFSLQLPQNKTVINILTADYPGEDFRHAVNNMTPELSAQFSSHLLKSEVIILLIDFADITNNDEEKQTIIREKLRAHLNAAYVVTQQQEQRQEKTAKLYNENIDICIGITKSDRASFYPKIVRSSDSGGQMVRKFLNTHWKHFENTLRKGTNIKEIRYFGLSAVGATNLETGQPVQGQIKPFGYEPMFRWIAERPARISWRKSKRRVFRFMVLVMILLFAVTAGFYGLSVIKSEQAKQQIDILNNQELTVTQRLKQTQIPVTEQVDFLRYHLLDTELNRIENKINHTNDEQTLKEIRDELKPFDYIGMDERKSQRNKLKIEIDNKSVEIEHKRVQDRFDLRSPVFMEFAEQFLVQHPLSRQADEVREWKGQYEQKNLLEERNRIRQISVINIDSLQEKSRQMNDFLEKYETGLQPDEASAMKLASALAKKFTERHTYSVMLNQYGGFAYAENQNVFIYTNDDNVVSHRSNGKVKTASPGISFPVTWQCGDTIRLELQGYGIYNYETAAGKSDQSPLALRCLNQKLRLSPKKGAWDWSLPKRMSSDGYFIQCTVQDIPDEDWKAFENYIFPGDGW